MLIITIIARGLYVNQSTRKYHIERVLLDLNSEFNTNVSVDSKNKIMKIFAEIESIIPQIKKIVRE